jgi:poly(3-hydroxybutyrate) depolymerase
MLYQIYETQRSLMEPFADLAEVAAKIYANPAMPMSQLPIAQRVSAAYDLMHRLGKDYEKPVFGIHTVDVDGVDVAIHERIEVDKPFCELRRFKRFSDDTATLHKLKGQPVVLIVAPLSGHYATLLRDTVRTMLKDHKVYITDWKNARLVPLSEGEFHLDDYINDVQDFIRYLQKAYGNCHVLSVCQPTVPVLAAISLMATRGETTPLTMTMMGGPIDARKSPTAVNDLAVERSHSWFENNVIYRVPDKFPGAGRRVYPGFLQHTGFVAMNPNRHADSHYDYFQDLIKGDNDSVESHRKFYDEYNAVLDMDADYYLETIETVFQEFKLMLGTWDVKNPQGKLERVRPQDITQTALLTVEGELDDISGSGQSEAAHKLCTALKQSQRGHFEAKGAGHYGIFSGRRWREMVYPVLHDFIVSNHPKPNQAKPAAKATVASPVKAAPVAASPAALPAKKAVVRKAVVAKAPVASPVKAAPVIAKPAAAASAKKAIIQKSVVAKAPPKAAASRPVKAVPVVAAKKAPVQKPVVAKAPPKAAASSPVKAATVVAAPAVVAPAKKAPDNTAVVAQAPIIAVAATHMPVAAGPATVAAKPAAKDGDKSTA